MRYMLRLFSSGFIILLSIIFFDPVPYFDKVNNDPVQMNLEIGQVNDFIHENEKNHNVRDHNHAGIIWADSLSQTEYSIVYLHGYGASRGEADPIPSNLSEMYNCNVYMSRLALHGLNDGEAFKNLSPEKLIDSAKEAIAIGKIIGEKVILMSTSTGSTLSVYLAANDPDVDALIMLSPNFELYDPMSKLMTKPWGKQLLKYIKQGDYHEWEDMPENIDQYWYRSSRIEGLLALRSLIDQTMTKETFQKINIPYYVGFFYKDENAFDDVISIDAIKTFDKMTSTNSDKKMVVPFANAHGHVIGCSCLNPNWEDVQDSIFSFCENILGIDEVERSTESQLQ